MQLILATENITEIEEEFEALVDLLWIEENPGRVVHAIDWPVYRALVNLGMCKTFTARNGRDVLVGLAAYVVIMHPHHLGHKVAECDMIKVNAEFRGLGIGRQLISYAEPLLIADGVQEIVHRHKLTSNTKPLFPSLGYEAVETVYRKKVA